MVRQISKGTCSFCHKEMSKSGIIRHLEACEQRKAMQDKIESGQDEEKFKIFHLLVEGYYLPMYWMHLDVFAEITLADMDNFLRRIWLECCGHLSAFIIEGVRYKVDDALDAWDTYSKNMHIPLDQVLQPGQILSYEYDFGSTTELRLKVVSEREVVAQERAIEILARNTLPIAQACDVCGKLATCLCTQYTNGNQLYLCDSCAKDHESDDEMLQPLVNSPRAGVCGYTGPDPAFASAFLPYI